MGKADSIAETLQEMEPLNAEQDHKVTSFLEQVKNFYNAALPPLLAREQTESRERLLAYKFLKARKWKMTDAISMFTSTVDFRKDRGLDEIKLFPCAFPLLGFDKDDLEKFLESTGQGHVCDREVNDINDACYRALAKSYVNLYHYTDKAGHPVLYDCCGQCDVKQILKDLQALAPQGKSLLDVIVPYHIYMNEVQHHLICYADHASTSQGGRSITGITVVMNAKGLRIGMIQRKTVQLVRGFLDVDQRYYPEVLHRLFVVNCPTLVNMAFNLVKHSLDENTRNKIIFCTKEDSLAVLQRVIDNDKIPMELGGGRRQLLAQLILSIPMRTIYHPKQRLSYSLLKEKKDMYLRVVLSRVISISVLCGCNNSLLVLPYILLLEDVFIDSSF
eukprot:gene13299-9137_t